MQRTTTSVLLAFSLLVTACGSNGDDAAAGEAPAEVPAEAPAATPSSGPTEQEEGSTEVATAAADEEMSSGIPAAGDPFAAVDDLDSAIEAYLEAVEGLSTDFLEEEQAASLHAAARDVLEAIWGADADGARQSIAELQDEIGDRLQEGTLSEEEAAGVIETLLGIDRVLDDIDTTVEIPIEFPPFTPECEGLDGSVEHAEVWVDAAGDDGGDGTAGAPFRVIEQALNEYPEEPVTVYVAPGTYAEDLVITSDTRIIADAGAVLSGTITSTEPRLVEIRFLLIEGAGAAAAAIDIDHPCAATVIEGVTIEGAVGAAVRHNGGTAHLADLRVLNSSAPDGVTPALLFAGGAQVTLDNVSVTRPLTGALLAADAGTRVTGIRVRVADSGHGAVEATDGAQLELVLTSVTGSRSFGIQVSGGASLLASATAVSGVVAVGSEGHALVVRSGGGASLRHFDLVSAQVCGALVEASPGLDLSWGEVRSNQIGACVAPAGYDMDRLRHCVVYRENGVNLLTSTLPLPGAQPFSPSATETTCPAWVTGG
jgi:hypothetical protein